MKNVVLVFAAVVLVAGCSIGATTLPVKGQTASGKQTFTGKFTAAGHSIGVGSGNGDLELVSNDGLKCSGKFVYWNEMSGGEGVFVCSDGRSGPFNFASDRTTGVGTGKIGNEQMTFTFGN